MVQNRKKHSKNCLPFSHELGSGWAIKLTNECSEARKRSKQCSVSEWVNGVSEQANGRASDPVLTSRLVALLIHSAASHSCTVHSHHPFSHSLISPAPPPSTHVRLCTSKHQASCNYLTSSESTARHSVLSMHVCVSVCQWGSTPLIFWALLQTDAAEKILIILASA